MKKPSTREHNPRIHYVRWGSAGPRVLLVHAIGFDHHTWEPLAAFLKRDYQLVALDLPGHGESEKPPAADYSLQTLGARVGRFMEEIGWDDAILVGNSLGGGTVLSLALQHPEKVRGLALLNSVAFREGLPLVGRLGALPLLPLFSSYAPPFLVRLGLATVRCDWRSVTTDRSRLCSRYLRGAEGRTAFFQTLRQLYGPDLDRMSGRYPEIDRPAVILHGERDWLIRLSHAERLATALPHAELVTIPRCGHFPGEEAPAFVARELRRFFQRAWRNSHE